MNIQGNTLTITNNDKSGYFDSYKTIRTGSILTIEDKQYRVLGLNNVELAFTGICIHLNVKEVQLSKSKEAK